jgi:hypothetical protein
MDRIRKRRRWQKRRVKIREEKVQRSSKSKQSTCTVV